MASRGDSGSTLHHGAFARRVTVSPETDRSPPVSEREGKCVSCGWRELEKHSVGVIAQDIR
jgi:hypothetical protein